MVSDLTTFTHKGFKRLLPQLPKVQWPNFLKFSKSFGKSKGKKWFQIWKLLVIKGETTRCKIKLVFRRILPYQQDFLVLVLISSLVKRFFVSCMRNFFFKEIILCQFILTLSSAQVSFPTAGRQMGTFRSFITF